MAFDFSLGTRDFGFSYSNRPFYDFFSFNGWEEPLIFFVVFLIGFVVSYTGLKRFFMEKIPMEWEWDGERSRQVGGGMGVRNKNALVIISLGIALLMTLGLLRNGWLFYYFGDIAGIVMSIIILMLLIVIVTPFYKAVEKNVGFIFAGILMGPGVWFVIKMISPHLVFIQDNFADQQWFIDFLGIPGLIVSIVVFLIIGVIRNKRNRP